MFKLSSWKAMVVLSFCCFATAVASRAQTLTTLVSFDGTNGFMPWSTTLIQATDGNLYGTTYGGGAYDYGTVFKVTPNGELTTLYSFCAQSGCPDGKGPLGGVAQGTDGNFYGTTSQGPANNGTFFKITPDGVLTTLYTSVAGAAPTLVLAANGNFYGFAWYGNVCSTVVEITPAGQLTTVHTFDSADGCTPLSLIQANDGNFYGTTLGGMANDACPSANTCGTVFEMTPAGNLTTLYSFQGDDGYYPSGGLVQGTDGNFYGTTWLGGAGGCGTVFVITPVGQLKTLHDFDGIDGCEPYAGLVQATDGNFYGVTLSGGPAAEVACQTPGLCPSGNGTIFEITSEGEFTNLYNFPQPSGVQPWPPAQPWGGLVQATDGAFYGTTNFGGTSSACTPGCGTVFSLSTGLDPFVKTEPASGEAGEAITILGTDLTGTTKVTFNGKAAEFKVVSSTEIAATVPAEASTGKVEVTTPRGALSSNLPFRVGLHPTLRHGRPVLKP